MSPSAPDATSTFCPPSMCGASPGRRGSPRAWVPRGSGLESVARRGGEAAGPLRWTAGHLGAPACLQGRPAEGAASCRARPLRRALRAPGALGTGTPGCCGSRSSGRACGAPGAGANARLWARQQVHGR